MGAVERKDQVRFGGDFKHPLRFLVEGAFDGVVLLEDRDQGWYWFAAVAQEIACFVINVWKVS